MNILDRVAFYLKDFDVKLTSQDYSPSGRVLIEHVPPNNLKISRWNFPNIPEPSIELLESYDKESIKEFVDCCTLPYTLPKIPKVSDNLLKSIKSKLSTGQMFLNENNDLCLFVDESNIRKISWSY